MEETMGGVMRDPKKKKRYYDTKISGKWLVTIEFLNWERKKWVAVSVLSIDVWSADFFVFLVLQQPLLSHKKRKGVIRTRSGHTCHDFARKIVFLKKGNISETFTFPKIEPRFYLKVVTRRRLAGLSHKIPISATQRGKRNNCSIKCENSKKKIFLASAEREREEKSYGGSRHNWSSGGQLIQRIPTLVR